MVDKSSDYFTMWPMLLDMSKEECKRILRRMELDAYSSIVSAFRAQGDLTKEKKKILQDLQSTLSISTERHRAEVRRAVNDEKLSTIADHMCGPSTDAEWMIEGRRLIPLMPRLVPQTAFTVTANQMANLQAEKNAAMPSPSRTGSKELSSSSSSPPTPVSGTVTKVTRPASPNSNVVVLPSGMSIHIKGGLNTEEEEEMPARKRRRSQSSESINIVSPSAGTQTPRVTYSTTASTASGMSPVKITISKSPQTRPQVATTTSQSQKVILVSSSGQASSSSILHQKSITVPVVKTTSSLGTTPNPKSSNFLPTSGSSSNGNLSNIVTMATPMSSTSNSATTAVSTSTMTFLTPTVSIQRPRPKTVPRQRFPVSQSQQKPGVVIPMGPQPIQPSPQSMQNFQIKPVGKSPSTIQIRQEGGMKIITQSFPGSGGSKILPKPSQLPTSSGTPVVVVSPGASTSSNVTMVTKPITSIGQAGTKILNITTQGGKVISTGTSRGPNVVTVNPKTLHLTAVKSATGGSGKPNVIVVQKTQPRRLVGTPTSTVRGTTVISSPFEKELVSFLQKQDSTKHIVVTSPSGTQRPIERKVIVTTPGQLEATRQRVRIENAEGKLIQDLIQAASQDTEGGGDVTINLDEATLAALTGSASSQSDTATSKGTSGDNLPSNEWFEYDDNNPSFQAGVDNAAVQALIEQQSSSKPKVTVQRSSSVDIGQLSDQLSQQQFYTIEQAMKILNNPEQSEAMMMEESQESTSEESVVIETVNTAQGPEITSQNELEQIARNLNLQGDLDPQTGIFYTVTNAAGQTETRRLTAEPKVVTESAPQGEATPGSKAYDLLSSSLAQAQIDLDPYQFIEEDVLSDKSATGSQADSGIVEIATSGETSADTTEENIAASDVSDATSTKSLHTTTLNTATIRIKPGSSFIPIQELAKSSTINVTQTQLAAECVSQEDFSTETVEMTGTTDFLSQPAALTEEVQLVMDSASLGNRTIQRTETVTVETTETVDPTEVSLDEFVVMDNPIPGTSVGETHSVDPLSSSDPTGLARLGKRKRKVPAALEDSPTPLPGGGWNRACLGLIQKVMKYRGLNRHKDDLNASTWFLEPVDPEDAPDYYTIIKNPMDFGTIKKKLESLSYPDYEDFHSDMLLVRDNCRLYNPPGSVVRGDCDEVFAYYMSEYERILEKWQKAHISSPSSKKLKFESRSPKM
ncbi:BRCA2-interacting transcriptional repressor EMSY-like [Ostrea edulis]|uniref:BRCA2-interacting transcriptional repressor EMSY-like n=1 Tax=Ostrea edulis TaxID=37623 RepID=UPI0024AF538B|nr:BRCA2-interacting transcriptional repressor EMSY-like [Ostrea edulis]